MRNFLDIFRDSRTPSSRAKDIDDFFDRVFRTPLFEEFQLSGSQDLWQPDFDIDETDDTYFLCFDLPGVQKEDVKVDLYENCLTISAERKLEQQTKRRFERSYGRFQRTFNLPMSIDADKVEASIDNGVLNIALPKSEKVKSRPIEVQSGKTGLFSKLVGSSKKEPEKTETTKH
jgi:HSP20 family protein